MGISPAGGSDGRVGIVINGDLHLPPLEQSCTHHYDQVNYGPVSGSGEASGVTGG